MPYIKEEDKEKFEKHFGFGIDPLPEIGAICENPGDLNYVFTRIIHAYIKEKGLRYQNINDVMGALDGASKEFYRRVAAPYEDKKIAENGDVMEID